MHPHHSAITEPLYGKACAAIPLNFCVMKPTQQYQWVSVRLGTAIIKYLRTLVIVEICNLISVGSLCSVTTEHLCGESSTATFCSPCDEANRPTLQTICVVKIAHPHYWYSVWRGLYSNITKPLFGQTCTATPLSLCVLKPHATFLSICVVKPECAHYWLFAFATQHPLY